MMSETDWQLGILDYIMTGIVVVAVIVMFCAAFGVFGK